MGTALVTGIAGQDGIYLARRLRREGMRVVGTVLPGTGGAARVACHVDGVEVVALDLRDAAGLRDLVPRVAPDEVYNLAAVSSVGRSWSEPELTLAVNGTAVEVLVEALLDHRAATGAEVRLFQASSAESDRGAAASPYARSKALAEEVVRAARADDGLHASLGRLYVHDSPLRSEDFVSRRITAGVAAIAVGASTELALGTLDVVRDWGFAGDYVDAIRGLVRLDEPRDLPIGSGAAHTLRDFVASAFAVVGLEPEPHVVQDPARVRPAETRVLVADPRPAARELGWRATTPLADLVAHMVRVDLARLRTGVEDDRRHLDPAPWLNARLDHPPQDREQP